MAIQPISFNVAPISPAALGLGQDRPSPLDDIISNAISSMFQEKVQTRMAALQAAYQKDLEAERYARQHEGDIELAGISNRGAAERNVASLIADGRIEAASEDDPFSFMLPGAPGTYRRPGDVARAQPYTAPGKNIAPGVTRGDVMDAQGNIDQNLAANAEEGDYEADLTAAQGISVPAARAAAIAALQAARESGNFYSRAESTALRANGLSPVDIGNFSLLQRNIMNASAEQGSNANRLQFEAACNTQVRVKGQGGAPDTTRDLTYEESKLLGAHLANIPLTPDQQQHLEAMYNGSGGLRFIQRIDSHPDVYTEFATRFQGAAVAGQPDHASFIGWLMPHITNGKTITNQAIAAEIRQATGFTQIDESALAAFARLPQSAKYRALYTLSGRNRATRSSIEEYDYAGQELPFSLNEDLYKAGETLYGPGFNDTRPGPMDGRNVPLTAPATAAESAEILRDEQAKFDATRKTFAPILTRLPPEIASAVEQSLLGDSPADIASSLLETAKTIRANATGANAAQANALATVFEQFGDVAAKDPLRFVLRRDSIFLPMLRQAQGR